MTSLLVPWILEAAVSFLYSNKKHSLSSREGKLVQILSKVEGTTSSFVVHDTQLHVAVSFTERAVGRYIKSGRELGHLVQGRAIVSLEEWDFVIINEKQIVLIVDKFRHVMDGSNSNKRTTEYLMGSGSVQTALESYLGKAKLPMQVIEEEDEEEAYLGEETLEPGDWNCLESFHATQTQMTPKKNALNSNYSQYLTPATNNAQFKDESEEEYEIPTQQWDLIVEQMVGAGLSDSPYKMSPKKSSINYTPSPKQNLKPFSPVKPTLVKPSLAVSSPVRQTANTPMKPNSPLKHTTSSLKHSTTPLEQSSTPLQKTIQSPLLERFEKVANVLLDMRPVYSSSSPNESSPFRTVTPSPIKSTVNSPNRVMTNQPTSTSSTAISNSKINVEPKPVPRYEVNMTPRRVLFEDNQPHPLQQSGKNATPKRLRLYTDW